MKKQLIAGVIFLILGIASLGFSTYIQSQVDEGKVKIAQGESKVKQGKTLFSLTPVTKELGKGITGGAEKQINEGKQKVSHYETIAERLKIAGIILLFIGGGFFLVSLFKKR